MKKHLFFLIVLLCPLFLFSQKAESILIGDFFAGGVVFWLDGNGSGLVCAITDQEINRDNTLKWGCMNNDIDGADDTIIGTGKQNTIDIVADCNTTGIVADVCSKLSLNGYEDWFLPSKDELNEMYLNKAAIDARAIAMGGTGFGRNFYWSSTEYDTEKAYWQYFLNGVQEKDDKRVALNVRAVRAF